MIPLLAVGVAGASLGAMYNVGQAYDSWKYWNDYYRNTGYRPKYPFRSGSMDYMKYMSRASYVPYMYRHR